MLVAALIKDKASNEEDIPAYGIYRVIYGRDGAQFRILDAVS